MTDPTDPPNRGALRSVKDPKDTLLPTPDKSYLTSLLGVSTSFRLWSGTNMPYPDSHLTHWLHQSLPLVRQSAFTTHDPGDLPE